MKSFHSDHGIKEKYLARVIAHREADEIIKGKYWQGGKGCAVGCTIHSGDHAAYETELGIPEWLAHLEDKIFEGLPNGLAMTWPERFLHAIPVGVDLDQAKSPFMIYVLESCYATFDHDKFPNVKKCIDNVIELHQQETPTSDAAWAAADDAAMAAARAARAAAADDAAMAAARDAADDAAWAAADDAAWAAANAAAMTAAWAAANAAARDAADDAAWAAANAAARAARAANNAVWAGFSIKLLELLRSVK